MTEVGLSALEQVLAEASSNPASMSKLTRLLLEGQLYVLVDSEGKQEPGDSAQAVVHSTFQDSSFVSAYTSLERLESVFPCQPYRALPAAQVFGAVRPGEMLILNLGSWPNRTFTSPELADLVARSGSERSTTEVRQPDSYPARLLEALWVHFEHGGKVNEAYLVELQEGELPPQLAVGVRVAQLEQAESVLAAARDVAGSVYPDRVRFLLLGGDQLSRRVVEEGVCFFSRGPSLQEQPALASSLRSSWCLVESVSTG